MANEQEMRKIVLFFFLTLLEEKAAFEAAHRAVSTLKTKGLFRNGRDESVARDAAIIAIMKRIFEQFKKTASRNPLAGQIGLMVDIPKDLDLATWRSFQKMATENESMAVALSKILGFADEAVAMGLNVSLGTVRYRIGKGIRTLGEHVKKT